MRWRHPRQGVVLPGAFVTVAEESGLIVPLGRWVLREACRQLARWTADPGIDLPCLTVNLSGRQLAEASLPDELAAILRQTGVPPERLGLELTESVLMQESASPTAVLQDLKGLGVRLMLDDFGTGYSSLNHVKRFPIEAIKVDREFTTGVAEDEGDRHILRAIVSMASAMDVAVIAEGVETREQARWLRHLGIKLVQGYAFGRPAPADTIEALLRDGLPLERLALAFQPIEGAADAAPRRGARPARARRRPRRRHRHPRRGRGGLRRLRQHRAPLGRHRPHRGRAHERRPPPLPRRRAAAAQRRARHAPHRPPRRAARRRAARARRAARERRRRAQRGRHPRPLRQLHARAGSTRPGPPAARPLEHGAQRRHPRHRLRRGARRHPPARHAGRPRGRLAARAPHASSSATARPSCARCRSAAPRAPSSSAPAASSPACARSRSTRPTRRAEGLPCPPRGRSVGRWRPRCECRSWARRTATRTSSPS